MDRQVNEARNGSRTAVTELFERCWKVVWPAVFAVLGNQHQAEDAAQEAIDRIFRSLERFDETRPLEPWVRRIAVNTALNQLRKERKAPLPIEWIPEIADVGEPAASFSQNAISEAIRRLEPTKRTVVVLHYWLDWSVEDIADALAVPFGTAASHLSRALQQLRRELEASHV